MGSYIKDNRYVIVKLLLNQFGSAIMGLILTATVLNVKYNWLIIAVSSFCVCFYMVVQYTSMWDIGARDIIRIEGNRLSYRPHMGAVMAVVAGLPNFIVALTITIGMIFGTELEKGGAFAYEWAGTMAMISRAVASFWEPMYNGFIQLIVTETSSVTQIWLMPLAHWLIPLPAIIAAGLGYFAGLKNFQIIKTKKKTK